MAKDYKAEYAAKLRDPRWQKMRLEIMQRDEFTCQQCHNKERTLNIHHMKYIRGRNPWEYPPEHLITLCEICHMDEKENHEWAKSFLIDIIERTPTLGHELYLVAELIRTAKTGRIIKFFNDVDKLLTEKGQENG